MIRRLEAHDAVVVVGVNSAKCHSAASRGVRSLARESNDPGWLTARVVIGLTFPASSL
jgi:hypothetical protein